MALLPPSQNPRVPCHAHVAEEGAVHVSEHGCGGGGACVRGVCPSSQPAWGRGRWAPMGGCEAQGNLPSESNKEGREEEMGSVSVFFNNNTLTPSSIW